MKKNQYTENNSYRYAENFCEENIFHLAKSRQINDCKVLILSNPTRSILLAHQKSGQQGFIIWDYHVILLEKTDTSYCIWDLDSSLGTPVAADHYIENTFQVSATEKQYQSLIKVINSETYLNRFSSDRRHMKAGETWLSPPPPWPVIGEGHSLELFLDMNDENLGAVVTPSELYGLILS